jgi:trehalose synthase
MSTAEVAKAAAPTMPSLQDYAPIVGEGEIIELRELASRLAGRRVKMVNSTAVGGGVAEILNRLVPLMAEVGLATQWDVITGGEKFFHVTKAFHNALHGAPYQADPKHFEIFREYTERNKKLLRTDVEFTVIHDPQPAGLIEARNNHGRKWLWRCHIDLSQPNPDVWQFLEPYIKRFDGSIFSAPQFSRQLPIPQYLFYPSIDPLSDKNRDLEPELVNAVVERFGIDRKRPLLTQISRFDRLKDPVGVIRAYKIVKRYFDCQLALAGGTASDDPEGSAVLAEVREAAGNDPDIHVLELAPSAPSEVNALQRASTIVIQKSLREGFGLTVAEALWKKKPVVASAVGGIPTQVIHKQTGLLAHSIEGAAYQIRYLLSHPDIAARLGEQGYEHVREQFLITGNVKRYLNLFLHLFS